MRTELYWTEGAWPGRLAIMPRPRGGDWLEDDVLAWRQAGVDVVVSLLTPDEVAHFDLAAEEQLCRTSRIEFLAFPITDREVPESREDFAALVTRLANDLSAGRKIAIHCRQGIGRSALVAVCALVLLGIDPETAIRQVGSARGCTVPETPEQRRWILDFAHTEMKPSPR